MVYRASSYFWPYYIGHCTLHSGSTVCHEELGQRTFLSIRNDIKNSSQQYCLKKTLGAGECLKKKNRTTTPHPVLKSFPKFVTAVHLGALRKFFGECATGFFYSTGVAFNTSTIKKRFLFFMEIFLGVNEFSRKVDIQEVGVRVLSGKTSITKTNRFLQV